MSAQVALIDMKEHGEESMREARQLLGGLKDINTRKRDVVIKLGVFHHLFPQHTSVPVTKQIVDLFEKAPRVYLAESDNYKGTGDERLQIWRSLFTERVIPFNLSNDTDTKPLNVENPIREVIIDLSHILFKPNVFVSTHVLRGYKKGSVLKNLFGLPPIVKKAQYHKNEIFNNLLPALFEAIGGIDLAVLDASSYHLGFSGVHSDLGLLVVGRDAVAVETVGYSLLGYKIKDIKTIQAFVERGLGIGEFDNIEVVGADFDEMKTRTEEAVKAAKDTKPKRWSASLTVSALIKDGYFKLPHKRSQKDVEKILVSADSRADGKSKQIYSVLRRRYQRGILKGEKGPDGWLYWTEK